MKLAAQLERVPVRLDQMAGYLDATRWSLDFVFDELKILARYCEIYKAPKGTVLFGQGDKDPYMALIWQGSVHVVKQDRSGEPKVLATLNRNQTLGEMSLIDAQPRSAGALCAEDSQLIILSRERLDQMRRNDPKIWGTILLQFCKMLSQRVRELSGEIVDLRK